ncbi:MAG: tRNA uridine-5-carboxymethylaminomethyl(34) synthesis GTPase MnmE, partial [Clostridia bacterium]|nr:tRNA uridine-5-carboxymethylaminomethyl(34) synthesis GTPase MnmE [Clostridia bacterium]
VNQLSGHLSGLINEARNELLRLIAYIEADIDFPEDDIERLTADEQLETMKHIQEKLKNILQTSQKGKIIREGLNVTIVGKPNVGKSSLLNALLKESKAIVTDIPGTTRDVIEEYINLSGIPIKLIDTAGIRDTDNLVEKIGVEKTKEFIQKADLVLYVCDIIEGLNQEDIEIIQSFKNTTPSIFVVNKIDLEYKQENLEKIKAMIGINEEDLVFISAKENMGLEQLEEKIIQMFFAGNMNVSDSAIVSNARHVQALQLAIDHLEGAINTLENHLPGDFVVIDLRSSWEYLGKITGDTIEDDILDQIFSQFCLGK